MATIMRHEEQVRLAIKYILEQQEVSSENLVSLLDDAGVRFNLSPLDQEVLERMFRKMIGTQT